MNAMMAAWSVASWFFPFSQDFLWATDSTIIISQRHSLSSYNHRKRIYKESSYIMVLGVLDLLLILVIGS